MIRLGGRQRRSYRRRNYLPYQIIRRFQRDILIGFGLIVISGIVLLILAAATEPFSVRLIEEGPQYSAEMNDGAVCQIYETRPLGESGADVIAMIDCGDVPGIGIVGMFQYLFYAVLAVGVILVATGGFALLVATFVSREMLVIPVAVLGIAGGLVAIAWGLPGDAPGLVVQGLRDQAATGLLQGGGAITSHDAAVAWGIGLVSGSIMRLTRT